MVDEGSSGGVGESAVVVPDVSVVEVSVTPVTSGVEDAVASAPVLSVAPLAAVRTGAVSGFGAQLLAWLGFGESAGGGGGGGGDGVGGPLAWAALGFVR